MEGNLDPQGGHGRWWQNAGRGLCKGLRGFWATPEAEEGARGGFCPEPPGRGPWASSKSALDLQPPELREERPLLPWAAALVTLPWQPWERSAAEAGSPVR